MGRFNKEASHIRSSTDRDEQQRYPGSIGGTEISHQEHTGPEAPKVGGPNDSVNQLRTMTEFLADGTHVLVVEGELDLASSPRFATALNDAMVRAGRVVVDLIPCGFLDSSALRVLLKASSNLNGAGPLSLVIPPGLFEIFQVTHLDRALAIHPTRAAVHGCGSTTPRPGDETDD